MAKCEYMGVTIAILVTPISLQGACFTNLIKGMIIGWLLNKRLAKHLPFLLSCQL